MQNEFSELIRAFRVLFITLVHAQTSAAERFKVADLSWWYIAIYFKPFFFFLANFVFWNEPSFCCLIVLVICSAKLPLDVLVLLRCCNIFPMDSCLSRHFKSSQFSVSEKVSVSEWFLELQFSFKEHKSHRVGGKQLSALHSHLIRI